MLEACPPLRNASTKPNSQGPRKKKKEFLITEGSKSYTSGENSFQREKQVSGASLSTGVTKLQSDKLGRK